MDARWRQGTLPSPLVQGFEIETTIAAPPASVWELLANHRGWADWAGVREVVLRQEGDPPPNGLGAIRVLRLRGLALEEEILGFDPPKRMSYRLSAGLPIRDHAGEIELEPAGDGTALRWTVRFRPSVPGTGWLLRAALERGVRDVCDRLARTFAD